MKKFILLCAFFVPQVWGQDVTPPKVATNLKFNSYEQVKNSADELRKHKSEIREFFFDMIARKAQMDVATVLKKNHMAESDIEQVVDSDEMKQFLNRLKKDSLTQAKVDNYVNKLLAPGYIEAYVMKQREQLTKQIQGDVLIARNELRKSENFRNREEVFTDNDNRSLARKVWDHLVDDLYRN